MSNKEDIFDVITMAEERFHEKGYSEGLAIGATSGYRDGYNTGIGQAVKIGSEVGFYCGFTSTMRTIMKGDEKNSKMNSLVAMMEMLDRFDCTDVHRQTFMEELEKIRAKFKQVCANLGISPQFGMSSPGASF